MRMDEMERKLAERLAALLREEDFETSQEYEGVYSVTVSGRKGNIRAVVHITEREAESFRAIKLADVPNPTSVRMKAGLPPGVLAQVSVQGLTPRGGAGGERPPGKRESKGA
jgi:hypothetical protein